LSSTPLNLFTPGKEYLDTVAAYTSTTIDIVDKTSSITLNSNNFTGMTDFTGQCKYEPCTPPFPQFLNKPTDQIIRLNIKKILYLEISHPRAYFITTSFLISNAGDGIVSI
jgi:hypothetical protein